MKGVLRLCWSGEASAAVAAVGFASGVYSWRRGDSRMVYAPVMYFAGMEALQAFTYTVVDQCAEPRNQLATFIAYVHICGQPLFINALSLYFIPTELRQKIQAWVYVLAALLGVSFLMRAFPFDFLRSCMKVSYNLIFCRDCSFPIPLCGEKLCAVSGNWHIAWSIPLKFHPVMDNAYVFATILLPLLYGSWRITLYLFLAGPFLAAFTTTNPNEWPAVWCLFSTVIIGVAVNRRIRNINFVKSWYGLKFW